MGSSVQARITGRTKVLLAARPAQLYLAMSLAERSDMDCVEVGPADPLGAFYEERPDLVLVDCGDPGDGCLAAITTMRRLSDVPIMALIPEGRSSRDVVALGVDAMASTPIRWDEFEARIDRLLDRMDSTHESSVLADDFIEIDRRDHAVRCSGREIDLTPTEFRMLLAFAERPGVALEHPDLLDLVWQDAYRGQEEVKLYVSYLRKKFKATGINPIETVRGFGYRYRPHFFTVAS